jgi:hypothetical protein
VAGDSISDWTTLGQLLPAQAMVVKGCRPCGRRRRATGAEAVDAVDQGHGSSTRRLGPIVLPLRCDHPLRRAAARAFVGYLLVLVALGVFIFVGR